ncbi:type VI secretion system tip protein TssI/VgrG [Paracoccus sp. CPCC 101403]|uniref:Type VI secretion system tip protein TssI/VgrG n=1 Tax=Paracoccus broussonetiae TaxID=3075834 RepID=A0ABU3EDJ6_9RHOB|nr:type VI secretion system tip protein TssI/VgrG [Paracoccus sp. CPCC 101403]MDT1062311.1 type VI secretion system tip protein TssI/VgrG [Paracoccus sp. CPCC 101403]
MGNKLFLNVMGEGPVEGLQVRRALVLEGLSQITETRIEVLSKDRSLVLGDFVGKALDLSVESENGDVSRVFRGLCISAEYRGVWRAYGRYLLEARSRIWLLGRTKECRVFQNESTPEIVQKVLGDYGLSGSLKNRLTQQYERRDYCLQYRETDFDFLSRLMEEEGISYYFTHEGQTETMVLVDAISGHDPMPGEALEYDDDLTNNVPQQNRVRDLHGMAALTTGKVTLADQNFEKSNAKLMAVQALPKGRHSHREYENYLSPGHFRETGLGKARARVLMEAEAARHALWSGVTSDMRLAAGSTTQINHHPQNAPDGEYLVTTTSHAFQTDPTEVDPPEDILPLPSEMRTDANMTRFGSIPKSVQFRAPLLTPWPEVPGVMTATVVGPAGEEIHTDKYGRVRVQFFWDRLGKMDDKAGIFVRVVQPWTGKSWGMVSIPRIGQEVLVGFENGDPDRPIILGMLYNANTMPPWTLPANQTQSGIKTNSSKEGGGFNELMFEDKKGEELVRFQAEKDYTQIVKNNATITVGPEKQDKGDMTLTVHRNLTETLKTGDHSFTVAEGNQTIAIKKDKTETIEGKSDLKVTGNVTAIVERGNVSETVQTGNVTHDVSQGNFSLTTALGKIKLEAMQEILLQVGASSIKIDQTGVTVKGAMIKVEGTAMIEAKAPMTTVKGDAILILKGALTMIN